MTVDDLILESRLVDASTGEIIGYMFRGYMSPNGTIYRVCLTEPKINKLGMDIASWLQYAEADITKVVKDHTTDMIALESNAIAYDHEFEAEGYLDDEHIIYRSGYAFERYRFFPLDDEVALQRALGAEDV